MGIVCASKGFQVCLNDVNESAAAQVQRGELPYVEYGAEDLLTDVLRNGNLRISLDPKVISEAKYVIIAIGTPVDEYMNPKTGEFLEAITAIKQYLSSSQTIIVRSSVLPHTCAQIMNLLGSDKEFHLAYCPERIVQGFAVKELETLPQIVAGFSNYAVESAAKLFEKISSQVIRSSMGEAELAKLFSNSWRYIQFAIANQFYMIATDYGEDYNRIREVMTDGYDRAAKLPFAGFSAGPCLVKDTMHLLAFNNNHFLLGQAAMTINEGLPAYVVSNLKKEFKLKDLTIGILGMAFKPEVDDIRDSLSFKLKKILNFEGAKVLCSDEFAEDESFVTKTELIDKSKVIIVATNHKAYQKLKIPKDKVVVRLS